MATEETLEQKNSRLEAENKALLKQKSTAETAANTSKEALDKLKTEHDQLKGEHGKLTNLHRVLSESFNSLEAESSEEIKRLSQELDSAKSDNAKSIVTTTVDGKKFRVIGKNFNIKGKGVLRIDQVLKDKALLKELVKQQVGFLVAVD